MAQIAFMDDRGQVLGFGKVFFACMFSWTLVQQLFRSGINHPGIRGSDDTSNISGVRFFPDFILSFLFVQSCKIQEFLLTQQPECIVARMLFDGFLWDCNLSKQLFRNGKTVKNGIWIFPMQFFILLTTPTDSGLDSTHETVQGNLLLTAS